VVRTVTPGTLAAVIADQLGVPVGEITATDQDRLLELEKTLRRRVRAQDPALKAVAEALKVSRTDLGNRSRPRGVLLFAGPTGVGKTETARALAEALFGPKVDQHFLQLDMAELSQEHMEAQLIGAPPGYVGYDQEGRLTGWLRQHPYCVLLFDEFEKAHPTVRKRLLSLFEVGRITDAQGRTVNGREAICIVTTNLLADKQGLEPEGELRKQLRKELTPELVNRIDRVIVFRALDRAALLTIAQMQIDRVAGRLDARGVTLEVNDEVKQWLVTEGTDEASGARELGRLVERALVAPIADLDLRGKLTPGARVIGTLDGDRVRCAVEPPK
jgi:ATP-dependent Clp protease ATP-binding subunit ClpC